MAKHQCKGTILDQDVASVYVVISQIISIDLPDMESETYDADTLDNTNAGIPYEPTGRTEGGSMSGELFYDPGLTDHQELTALLTTPAKNNWRIRFTNTGTSIWTFSGAGIGIGGTVALNDGLKANFSVKLNGIPTFTT
jgi:hypothetical protein